MLNVCSTGSYNDVSMTESQELRYFFPVFQSLTHFVPHVIAQSTLNPLSMLNCYPFCLVVTCLPYGSTRRIMQYCFARCDKHRKILCNRQFRFLFLRFLTQFRLAAYCRVLIISRNPTSILFASKTFNTPICAKALAPPPPNAIAVFIKVILFLFLT